MKVPVSWYTHFIRTIRNLQMQIYLAHRTKYYTLYYCSKVSVCCSVDKEVFQELLVQCDVSLNLVFESQKTHNRIRPRIRI